MVWEKKNWKKKTVWILGIFFYKLNYIKKEWLMGDNVSTNCSSKKAKNEKTKHQDYRDDFINSTLLGKVSKKKSKLLKLTIKRFCLLG